MFTGIIQAVGSIRQVESRGSDARYVIHTGGLDMSDVHIGDSIATQGVCLTAIEFGVDFYTADVSGETLSRTTLGQLTPGTAVNLEKSVTPTTRLGGHLVSGHVDGIGEVLDRSSDGRSERFVIRAPEPLAKYIAEKGSICVDGISLTVNGVAGSRFDLNIVPHTLDVTTMGDLQTGDRVNLEVDVVARYLERLMQGDKAVHSGGITVGFLKEHGFA
jgi:riboflavin synthase